MKVVILAGGLGSRMSEETIARPKPLVEIGDKPMLWHIMNIYSHHGLTDFIICAGYKSYMIKEYFVNLILHHSDVTLELGSNRIEYHTRECPPWRVTVVDTGMHSMTGGRLLRVRDYLEPGETFCMTYGDGVGDIDISAEIAFHKNHGLKATMCAVSPPGRFGAVGLEGDIITEFTEKPRGDNQRINGGFFVLEPSVLDLIDDDSTIWETGPLNELARNRELAAFRHDGFWQPMDTLREKMMLENLWDTGRAPWKVWN